MEKFNIGKIISFIESDLSSFYDTYLQPIKQLSFDEYILYLSTHSALPLDDFLNDIPGYRRFYKKAKVKTKLNWHKSSLRDLNEHRPGTVVEKEFNALRSSHIDDPVSYTWDMYYDEYCKLIDDWRKDNHSLLIDFPLIRFSTPKTKESALEKELYLFIIDLLEKGIGIESYNGEVQKGVLMQPLEFLLGPFVSVFSPGVQLTSIEQNPDKEGSAFLYNDYQVPESDGIVIRSIIDTSKSVIQETNIRSLSSFDISVFLYIVNYICENDYATFLATRTYQDNLSNIVRAVYPNEKKPGARCFEQVRRSLAKLAQLSVKGIRNKTVVRTINFFDSYELYKENGQNIVNLTIGRYMYDRISTKKIQLVYTHEVKLLNNRSAQFVYYVFESERQRLYALNRMEGEYPYSYTFFIHTMRFSSSSSKENNLNLIASIFQSFLDNDILIHSYKRRANGFLITFKPFNKDDIEKLKLGEPSLLPAYN